MKVIPQHVTDKLNRETSRIAWRELQSFYSQGAVLVVAPGMDLVAVAAAVAEDDTERVGAWLDSGDLVRAQAEQDARWTEHDAQLWAVVVAPWVLVQQHRERDNE